MGKLYIFGHLNPDTDSIVAAISYADLKRRLGETSAEAVRLGPVSPETTYVLDLFGFERPALLPSVRTQVKDIAFDMPPCASEDISIRRIWEMMSTDSVKAVPIIDGEGKLTGLCTAGDVAEIALKGIFHDDNDFTTTVRNLCDLLFGRLLCGADGLSKGSIQIAFHEDDLRICKGIVLAEWREGIENLAASAPADTVILCRAHGAKQTNGTCRVIATPYDIFRTARLCLQSTPVGMIQNKKKIVTFTTEDYIEDVIKIMMTTRYRSYPIVDAEGRVVGALSRIHLINHARKRVILVDHNEKSQSAPGLEQAEICEIIDHHRLGDVQTGMPMFFRNEPVGSTTTIIAGMFQENQLEPEPKLAELMLAAIVSDTVAFRSPTCTEKDRLLAGWLAQLADTDAEAIGQKIFHNLSEKLAGLTAQQIFFLDFKEYSIGGQKIGVGQITCWQTDFINTGEIQLHMDMLLVEERFDILLFMLTEIVREGTTFLHAEAHANVLRHAFGISDPGQEPFFLGGVMSRKKQVIPALSRHLL